MAISLGGVTLPDLVMSENFLFDSAMASELVESRAGTPIIFEQSRTFKDLDLLGDPDAGWITFTTLQSIQALADIPNTTYTLSYEGSNYSVKFRNWDPPVIEASPLVPRVSYESDDWFNNVVIKLVVLL
jgi:hypothetical protein